MRIREKLEQFKPAISPTYRKNKSSEVTCDSPFFNHGRSTIIIPKVSIYDSDLSKIPSVHIKKEKSIRESEDYYKERERCRC